jgi:hypothetical protein
MGHKSTYRPVAKVENPFYHGAFLAFYDSGFFSFYKGISQFIHKLFFGNAVIVNFRMES